MATIAEILARFWPNQQWTIDEDDYATLSWVVENPLPKPTEAEIRAHSNEVDALLADEAQRERQQIAMRDAPDYLLKVVETLIDGLAELRRIINNVRDTATASSHVGDYTAWDTAIVARIVALKQRVIELRNIS